MHTVVVWCRSMHTCCMVQSSAVNAHLLYGAIVSCQCTLVVWWSLQLSMHTSCILYTLVVWWSLQLSIHTCCMVESTAVYGACSLQLSMVHAVYSCLCTLLLYGGVYSCLYTLVVWRSLQLSMYTVVEWPCTTCCYVIVLIVVVWVLYNVIVLIVVVWVLYNVIVLILVVWVLYNKFSWCCQWVPIGCTTWLHHTQSHVPQIERHRMFHYKTVWFHPRLDLLACCWWASFPPTAWHYWCMPPAVSAESEHCTHYLTARDISWEWMQWREQIPFFTDPPDLIDLTRHISALPLLDLPSAGHINLWDTCVTY